MSTSPDGPAGRDREEASQSRPGQAVPPSLRKVRRQRVWAGVGTLAGGALVAAPTVLLFGNMIATGERMDVRNPLEWWLLAVGVWGVVTVAFSVAELWAFRRDSWVKWARLAALALVGGVFCVVGGLGLVLVLGPSLGMILNMVFSLIG